MPPLPQQATQTQQTPALLACPKHPIIMAPHCLLSPLASLPPSAQLTDNSCLGGELIRFVSVSY